MAVKEHSALITGGCGFIGVNLARTLVASGWQVTSFDDYSVGTEADGSKAGYHRLIAGDVRDLDAVRQAALGHSHVVHLAAHTNVIESVKDPIHDVEVNVDGLLNTLIAARDAGADGFVFASSNAPLGEVDPPTHEGIVPHPLSPYGASKLAGEALCSAFAGSYGLRTISLRFSNVYGPYSYHKGSVVAKFMRRIFEGEPLVLYGDGKQTRDFIYVDDLCDGVRLALGSDLDGGEVLHLGTGTEVSVNALVALLQDLFPDRTLNVGYEQARSGEIVSNFSDISKARREIGFEPAVGIEEGLRKTKNWFEGSEW
jgi:UDP-glucose 4-epimerase